MMTRVEGARFKLFIYLLVRELTSVVSPQRPPHFHSFVMAPNSAYNHFSLFVLFNLVKSKKCFLNV